MYQEKFMQMAIEEAKKCAQYAEVPVGAVIVRGEEVVARAGNAKERSGNALAHAEMLCIGAAIAKTGDWRLTDCDLYVTLEPCAMCAGAILLSRIRCLYFGAYDEKAGCCSSLYQLLTDERMNHRVQVEGGKEAQACAKLLTDFFRARRADHRAERERRRAEEENAGEI